MSKKTILLVEDNTDDIELTLYGLRDVLRAYEIEVARSGAEALDYLLCVGRYKSRDPNRLPELIILDIRMPGLSGLQVLRQIRSCDAVRGVPVVILSSSEDERDKALGYDLGANSFLCKPLDYTVFSNVMSQLGLDQVASVSNEARL